MHGDPQAIAEDGERRTQVVVAITLVMMVVEIATGLFTNSVALLADGWHMGTHAAALGITLYAYHFTRVHPDIEEGSVQASRANALGGFASAIVLGIVALYIGYEAFLHFVDRPEINYGQALPVAVIGLLVNGWCAWILGHGHGEHGHTHSHAHAPRDYGQWNRLVQSYAEDFEFILSRIEHLFASSQDIADLNLRGAYLHVLADALVSVFVILALLLGMVFPGSAFVFLDPLVGIIGGVVIARWALGLIRDSSRELLGLEH
ncbi:MAG: CDF family Co(II)/Ni(II) efflux transporter DmeF [Candidatus Thermoplasmatota archaeon]|nr:CDF family Co(II)/Ni(II) efflux transporter DmeF [Candidatus Thermoplasmatota archaeon]